MAIIRTDPAPGFLSIKDDTFLSQHQICLEIGRRKNPNKNPVAERAIQELELELLHQDPSENPVSPLTLSLAVSRLNSRLRHNGLSSCEMWSQRDQFTNSKISVDDEKLILEQHKRRQENHPASEKSKAPKGHPIPVPSLAIGDIVYLYADRNKHRGETGILLFQSTTLNGVIFASSVENNCVNYPIEFVNLHAIKYQAISSRLRSHLQIAILTTTVVIETLMKI